MSVPPPPVDSRPEADGWVGVAREHYTTSLAPWIGDRGREWLRSRTRSSADPNLLLVTRQVYDLWKGHATGAGTAFPRHLLKDRDEARAPVTAAPAKRMSAEWRAFIFLAGFATVSIIVVAWLLLSHSRG